MIAIKEYGYALENPPSAALRQMEERAGLRTYWQSASRPHFPEWLDPQLRLSAILTLVPLFATSHYLSPEYTVFDLHKSQTDPLMTNYNYCM